MKIVSKFRDYYDTASSFGIDKTVVFLRQQEVSSLPAFERLPRKYSFRSKVMLGDAWAYVDVVVDFLVVGFCGHGYPVARIAVENTPGLQGPRFSKVYYSYSSETFFSTMLLLNHNLRDLPYTWLSEVSAHSAKAFFDRGWWDDKLGKVFSKFRTPLFLLSYKDRKISEITTNPKLRDYGFQVIKDPYQAFQDIYGYIDGVLGRPEKPTIKISDRDMARKKGHDGKYSFKTPPGTKKRGKK